MKRRDDAGSGWSRNDQEGDSGVLEGLCIFEIVETENIMRGTESKLVRSNTSK
jgi:hypothetical protein